MSQAGRLFELNHLVLKILEGQATTQEIEAFNTLIRQDPQALNDYYEIIDMYADMTRHGGVYWNFQMADLQRMADYERTAPTMVVNKPENKDQTEIVEDDICPKIVRKSSRFPLVTAIALAAALIFIITFIHVIPVNRAIEVGTLSEGMKARFAGNESIPLGSRLSNQKEPYRLQYGIIKVALDRGTEVVIEAPSEFQFESAGRMVLHSGRIYATVPGQAKGFTVDTHAATIIDLGTEFGVKINYDGTSEVHVIKGKTTMQTWTRDKQSVSETVVAGQARQARLDGQVIDTPMCQEKFVQRVENQFMLDMNFEGQTGNVLPLGWKLIDNNGPRTGPDYTHVTDGGPAGVGDICGRVGPGDLENGPNSTPGGWIQCLKPFDSAAGFEGSFDFRMENTSEFADGQFLFGQISEGARDYYYVAIGSSKFNHAFFTVSAGVRTKQNLKKVSDLKPEVWYHCNFRFIPVVGASGRFSYEITSLAGDKSFCSLGPVEITLPEMLTFGFGNFNDSACFDNIRIHPLSRPQGNQP